MSDSGQLFEMWRKQLEGIDAAASPDHVPSHRPRAVEAPVQDDADYRVPAVGRQILGAADEVSRRVVDQYVDVAEVPDDAADHLIDLLRFSDIDLDGERIEAGMAKFSGALLEVRRVAAADREVRAELAETLRNREAEPCGATGDDRDLTLERRRCEHHVRLPAPGVECPRGC